MIVGIAMAKDERDVIAHTLAHMATQVDAIVIADNASTDGTRDLMDGVAFRNPHCDIHVIDDPEPAYLQSEKMTRLAGVAREMGATWVVPFDADEVWYCSQGQTIRDWLDNMARDVGIVEAELYDHVATGVDDPADENPLTRLGWRRRARGVLPKVAARTLPGLTIEMGNHGARFPGPVSRAGGLTVRHFPYRSVSQMVSKARNGAAAYDAAGARVPAGAGVHWREYGRHLAERGEAAIEEIFTTWFWEADPASNPDLIFDPAPLAG